MPRAAGRSNRPNISRLGADTRASEALLVLWPNEGAFGRRRAASAGLYGRFAPPPTGRTTSVSYPASGEPPERVGGQEGAPPNDQTAGPGTAAPERPRARRGQVPRTKTAVAWNTLIAGAVVLILLLVFILENTQSVKISYFGATFHLPLGVALLLAAIGGALLLGIVGTARIVQLRRRIRRPG